MACCTGASQVEVRVQNNSYFPCNLVELVATNWGNLIEPLATLQMAKLKNILPNGDEASTLWASLAC